MKAIKYIILILLISVISEKMIFASTYKVDLNEPQIRDYLTTYMSKDKFKDHMGDFTEKFDSTTPDDLASICRSMQGILENYEIKIERIPSEHWLSAWIAPIVGSRLAAACFGELNEQITIGTKSAPAAELNTSSYVMLSTSALSTDASNSGMIPYVDPSNCLQPSITFPLGTSFQLTPLGLDCLDQNFFAQTKGPDPKARNQGTILQYAALIHFCIDKGDFHKLFSPTT